MFGQFPQIIMLEASIQDLLDPAKPFSDLLDDSSKHFITEWTVLHFTKVAQHSFCGAKARTQPKKH